MYTRDIRISKKYYGKNIIISFKENSLAMFAFNGEVSGKLIGKITDEKFDSSKIKRTVVAIKIDTEKGEFNFPCEDILKVQLE